MPARRRSRGNIEKLPSGHYRAIVYAGVDPLTGRERRIKETAETYAEAKVALTRLQNEVDEDRHVKSALTVSEALDRWFEVVDLEATTRDRYEDLIRLYIRPTLGDLQAGKVDAELLERFYARLQRCRELCSSRPPKGHVCRPLSTSTTRKIHYIIRGTLERAVRWRYLNVNAAAMAQAPVARKTKPDPPSAAEAARLIGEAWQDPEWGLLLWLTMVTGCRRGELCALRWEHVDVERTFLWVSRSTAHPRSGITEKATKTEGQRRIGLDSQTMALLADHRERVTARLASLSLPLTGAIYIFSGLPDHSAPLVPRSVSQRYHRMAVRIGLRSARLHSLRHYSATELLAAGVDLRTVAGRLGHGGGGSTTLKTYAAWVEEADRRAADTMARIMPAPVATPQRSRGPYQDVANALRQDIVEGRLGRGDQLPTLVQLADQFSVATGTAHRAVTQLATEGLIAVVRGQRARVL